MAKSIYKKLNAIQVALHCPKSLAVKNYNGATQYNYRNLAGIMEAVKPLLAAQNCVIVIDCEPTVIDCGEMRVVDDLDRNGQPNGRHTEGGRKLYQTATATLIDCDSGESVSCRASAREAEYRKGMDVSQQSGSAESFASKYACEHLFALDSSEDADDLAAKDAAKAAPAATTAYPQTMTVTAAADPAICPCGSVKGRPWSEIETDKLKSIVAIPAAKAKALTPEHRNAIVAELAKRESAKDEQKLEK